LEWWRANEAWGNRSRRLLDLGTGFRFVFGNKQKQNGVTEQLNDRSRMILIGHQVIRTGPSNSWRKLESSVDFVG
jgi:hypothetical protein